MYGNNYPNDYENKNIIDGTAREVKPESGNFSGQNASGYQDGGRSNTYGEVQARICMEAINIKTAVQPAAQKAMERAMDMAGTDMEAQVLITMAICRNGNRRKKRKKGKGVIGRKLWRQLVLDCSLAYAQE